MRLSHEVIPPGADAPTPKQLFGLALRALLLGKQHNRLEQAGNAKPRAYVVMPLTRMIMPDLLEDPFRIRCMERLSAKVSCIGPRSWSLRYCEMFRVTGGSGCRSGVRNQYNFDWNSDRVTVARHCSDVIPILERDFLDSDDFSMDEQTSDEWLWRIELETMTARDVDLLTREIEKRIA